MILGIGVMLLIMLLCLCTARPIIGGLFIIISSPLNVLTWNGLGFNVRLYELFTLATLLGLVLQVLLRRRTLSVTNLQRSIIMFCFILGFTLAHNGGNKYGYVLILSFSFLAVMYFVITNNIENKTTLIKYFSAIILIGDIIAGLGLLQVAGQYLGLQSNVFHTVHYTIVEVGRPMGTFTDPGWFGIYTMFIFLLILPLLSSHSGWRRIYFWASLFIQIVAIFLSFARAAWVGAILAVIIYSLMPNRTTHKQKTSKKRLLYVLFSIFIILFLWRQFSSNTFVSIINRMTGVDLDNSIKSRIFLTQITLEAVRQKIIFGHGIGSWESELLSDKVRMGPNMFISIMYDAGLLGLVSLLWLLIALLSPLITEAWHPKNGLLAPYTRGILLGILGILISFQFTSGYNYEWFWVVIALGGGTVKLFKNVVTNG